MEPARFPLHVGVIDSRDGETRLPVRELVRQEEIDRVGHRSLLVVGAGCKVLDARYKGGR
jgi:hypothetical protein